MQEHAHIFACVNNSCLTFGFMWFNSVFFLVYLGVLVGHVTLRQLKPECDLDPAWAQEDLSTATQRTISLLHTNTVLQREGKTDE